MPWYVWACVGMAVLQFALECLYSALRRGPPDTRDRADMAGAVAGRAFWVALATFLLVLSRGG